MGDQRYQDVKRIFLMVADLPPEKRGEALASACGQDASLRDAVERLLSQDAGDATRTRGGEAAALWPIGGPAGPERIGPYRVLSRLGEGGFGVVYLAEQVEPVRRRVALKVIKPGMDSARVVARFEAERQALAMMDHPNIAKVFDAGTTAPEQGSRPYFAMEHVAGEPLTDYCDRHGLPMASRLRLFVTVCGAIQHAHAKGIIHRDIKPSNVLVSVREGEAPVAKVIDFGVAKALHQPLTESSIFTEQGQIIGTPEYMSPEQAEMGALDIDTRSDVYSLGVLLYELLVGARPFDLRRAAVGEIARIIRDVDPPRPSTRVTASGEQSSAWARKRRTTPHALARQLSGELEWIPLKAIRKDRTERYQSAADLARDIERYLAGEALVAGPESLPYRARKFAGRHRVALTVAGVIALAALGAGASTILSLRRAVEAERRQLLSERARATDAEVRLGLEREARLAAEFVARVFGGTRQWGPDVLLRDVLSALSTRLNAVEGMSPGVASRARTSLGHSYLSMAMADQAQREFERARELAATSSDQEALANALAGLGAIALHTGRYDEALAKAEEAASARAALVSPAPEDVSNDLSLRGQALWHLDRLPEAEQAMRGVIQAEQRINPPRAERVVALMTLARIHSEREDATSALDLTRQALAALDNPNGSNGADDLLRGQTMHQQGLVLRTLGRYADAEVALADAVPVLERALAQEHPSLRSARQALTDIRAARVSSVSAASPDELAAAKALLEAPVDAQKFIDYQRGGWAMFQSGEGDLAIRLLDRAIESARLGREQNLAQAAPQLVAVLGMKAVVLRARGMLEPARRAVDEALSTLQHAALEDAAATPNVLYNAALIHQELGHDAQAEALCRRAIAHPRVSASDAAESRRVLGLCLLQLGRPHEAEASIRLARAGLEALPPRESWRLWRADSALAKCLRANGRDEEALDLLRRLAQVVIDNPGPSPYDARRALLDAAEALAATGDQGEAQRLRDAVGASRAPSP